MWLLMLHSLLLKEAFQNRKYFFIFINSYFKMKVYTFIRITDKTPGVNKSYQAGASITNLKKRLHHEFSED